MQSLSYVFQFFPDAPAAGTPPTPTPDGPVRTPALPRKDDDIARVAKDIAHKWSASPQITLLWITEEQFADHVAAFVASLGGRQSTGSNRPAQTQTLRHLAEEMDKGLSFLKLDIQRKFGKEGAYAQYSRYGLEKKVDGYVLPADRDKKLAGIKLIPAALVADGINGAPYDKVYWTNMITRYEQEIDKARDMDSDVSGLVGEKNQEKETILKAMRALQLTLQGNYPDTYEVVYREWGWLKEDY